ncbi:MAG: MMPL family transporter [Phycisphaerales bacterium]|jgi:predicted RND superfamily exporter protein|nr:MMPL family transporter [Phycisphaerales bacterium]
MGFVQRRLMTAVLMVVKYPKLTLGVAGVVLAVCVAAAVMRLSISTDQNKLFSPDVKFFGDYLKFVEKFPENEAIYVLIEPAGGGQSPAFDRWTSLADAIDGALRPLDVVDSVESRVHPQDLGNQALLFEDHEMLEADLAGYRQFAQLLGSLVGEPGVDRVLLGSAVTERFYALMAAAPADEAAPLVQLVSESLLSALRNPSQPVDRFMPEFSSLEQGDPRRQGYAYLPDESDPTGQRHILLVTVHHVMRFDSLTAISQTVGKIRRTVEEVAKSYPEFHVALTGRPVLEADEMSTTDRDTHRAEIVALTCVFIGLVVMLRSLWLALAAELALGVGIGWTFGWATISIGELNLLSLVFVIALIGIGMDYLVQILTRYRREAQRYPRAQAVWARVFRYVSPPISTACLGAAGAFGVAIFTDFRGAADLGVIAGGGLLLCLAAGYTVLPAMLVLFPVKVNLKHPGRRYEPDEPPPRSWRRLVWPAVWALGLAAMIPFMLRTDFDPNLLNLQAQNLESVRMIRKLQTWSSVVLSKDLSVLQEVRQSLAGATTVAGTESILDAYDNRDWLIEHQKEIPVIQWATPSPLKSDELPRLADRVEKVKDKLQGKPAAQTLSQLMEVLRTDSPMVRRELADRINQWQTVLVGTLKELAGQFTPPLPDVDRLPPQLRNHLRAEDGTYALYIYPREQLWHSQPLGRFVREVESRVAAVPGHPDVTGIASNIYHSTASIENSFYKSTAYALALIVILVFIDMKSLSQTMLAVSVLALGLPMLIGIMGLFDVKWNFANFFGLPILIGAGHEYGVFMVHRYREVLHNPRRVWKRWDVSDQALLLCAFITSSSFGFFWLLGHHEGLKSLGWVMAVGTGCIYLATVLVVRPLLKWRLGRNNLSA